MWGPSAALSPRSRNLGSLGSVWRRMQRHPSSLCDRCQAYRGRGPRPTHPMQLRSDAPLEDRQGAPPTGRVCEIADRAAHDFGVMESRLWPSPGLYLGARSAWLRIHESWKERCAWGQWPIGDRRGLGRTTSASWDSMKDRAKTGCFGCAIPKMPAAPHRAGRTPGRQPIRLPARRLPKHRTLIPIRASYPPKKSHPIPSIRYRPDNRQN